MKKIVENKYPESAILFKFCRAALSLKYQGNVKIIDQDIGAILDFDPADCSHWKKGKKNIRTLKSINAIANFLNIDNRLLFDLALGRKNLEEVYFEFEKCGNFKFNNNTIDTLRKDYFRSQRSWDTYDRSQGSFEKIFSLKYSEINKIVEKIISELEGKPTNLNNIVNLFENITIINNTFTEENVVFDRKTYSGSTSLIIILKNLKIKPYLVYQCYKEIAKFLTETKHPWFSAFKDITKHAYLIHINIFASILLLPKQALLDKIKDINCTKDITEEISYSTGIPRVLINQRLLETVEEYF